MLLPLWKSCWCWADETWQHGPWIPYSSGFGICNHWTKTCPVPESKWQLEWATGLDFLSNAEKGTGIIREQSSFSMLTFCAMSQGKSLSWTKFSVATEVTVLLGELLWLHPYMNTFCFLLCPWRSQYTTICGWTWTSCEPLCTCYLLSSLLEFHKTTNLVGVWQFLHHILGVPDCWKVLSTRVSVVAVEISGC